MTRRKVLLWTPVVWLVLVATGRAQTTWYVDDNAANDLGPGDPTISDPNENGSLEHPFDAIQEGIDAACDGFDEVVVLDGTYTGYGNVWLDFQGKAITVRSQNGPEACVIDCDTDHAVMFDEYEDAGTVLEGFTITGAFTAISCGTYGGPTDSSSSPTINRCIFHHNGDGILVTHGMPTVSNCLFYQNAGAVRTNWLAPYAQFELINCTITDNDYGILHEADDTFAWIYNCIVWGNTNDVVEPPSLPLSLHAYWSNIHCEWQLPGDENIDADPLFADFPPSGLYRLSCNSPCVNEGLSSSAHGDFDLAGMPRITGSSVDMGASETTPCQPDDPSPSYGATEVETEGVILSWSDGGGATSYDVYFGVRSTLGPGNYLGNQSGTSYELPLLVAATTYYWRVDSVNSYGTCTGDVWRFTTTGSGPSSDIVKYVDASATGSESGESWENAFTRLQDALNSVVDHAEIWVAAGTYTPDRDWANPNGSGDRSASFELAHSVNLYGGFTGYESNLGQRDPEVNVTILSGDLAGDDGPDFANNDENSYHVVTCDTSWTGLDGFVVTGGNANGTSPNEAGGGMLIFNANPAAPVVAVNCTFIGNSAVNGGGIYTVNGSPYIMNCVFSGNSANGGHGGGLYSSYGNPIITDCVFDGNSSGPGTGRYGGGLYNGYGDPLITGCVFSDNEASDGGGLFNDHGGPSITNCVFSGNLARSLAGGIFNHHGSPSITNCLFSGNVGLSRGSGIFTDGQCSPPPSITNCTFVGNGVGGLHNDDGLTGMVVANSIVWGNDGAQIGGNVTATYSCVQGGYPGTGNIDADPLLLSIPGEDGQLRWGSPCIDAGDNGLVPAGVTSDLAGNDRFVDDPDTADSGAGTPPLVDMGAYEYQAHATPKWLYVNGAASAGGDGLSWATAYQYLQDALTTARSDPAVIEIWVAAGMYEPDRDAANPGGTGSRAEAFDLIAGVPIRGGFAGSEDPATFDLANRDFVTYATILSGDLAGDDGPDFANNGENSYHVVTDSSFGAAGVLDGFAIFAGNANGVWPDSGGGMCNRNGGSPTVTHCVFSGNSANGHGGGLYSSYGNPIITDCVFDGNSSGPGTGRYGGGLYNGYGDPLITGCVFSDNEASDGGGLFNDHGGPSITNCVFSGNLALNLAGGIFNHHGSPSITNCLFSGNVGLSRGSGIFTDGQCSPPPSITNCTFVGNGVGGLHNDDGLTGMVVANSIVWGNDGAQVGGNITATYSCIQDGWPGTGNTSSDPLFADPNGPDNDSGTLEDNDYRLASGSPCVDAADNTAVPSDTADLDEDGDLSERITLDLDFYPRFMNDPNTNDTGVPDPPDYLEVVDIGAYELPGAIYGDMDGDGDVDVADAILLLDCMAGPDVTTPPPGCGPADCDADADVDMGDLATFQESFPR